MFKRDLVKPALHHTKWQQPIHTEAISNRDEDVRNPVCLRNRTDLEHSDDGSVTDNPSIRGGKPMTAKTSSASVTTSRRREGRISFAKSKSLQQLIKEDREKVHRARKAQHAKDLKAKLDAENKAIEDQKKADKELAKRYNKEKKRREAEEDRNNKNWGGIVRGFDPNAGLLRCAASEDELRHSRISNLGDNVKSDSLTNILHPRLDKGQTWGVEHGSPGKRGRFGISSPAIAGSGGVIALDGGDD
ncbi:hypothetical protein LTR84_011608 [Exophiala bonariae]|uniref:Uncharacterized protein n=1 Tax=Exophiala bonariae TaxID=1690606 RepID=A0AAV9NK46_9EURO|nr:hypothetical protein LTR84_011608 [Exophiala bonariae]